MVFTRSGHEGLMLGCRAFVGACVFGFLFVAGFCFAEGVVLRALEFKVGLCRLCDCCCILEMKEFVLDYPKPFRF